jgi:hypothetical protein
MPDLPVAVLVVELNAQKQVERSFWEAYEDAVARYLRHQELVEPKSLISDTSFNEDLDTAE